MRREELLPLAKAYRDQMVAFCQRLVQTPSLPGQEGAVAELVRQEMERLGYDQVWLDEAGNVIGYVRGSSEGCAVMLHSHLDHVDPGPESEWPFPPYSGQISQGYLYGRGTADMKGALAAQVYGIGALLQAGYELPGDVYVVGVVMEEMGSLGTLKLIEGIRPDVAVVGEATSNQLARGHRGRVELVVRVKGRSVHASMPQRGVNPHYVMAGFMARLQDLAMVADEAFGSSTVAPTLYLSDQTSSNVTPGELRLHLDWRNVPGESVKDVVARLQSLLAESLLEGSQGTVEVREYEVCAYTGLRARIAAVIPPFALPPDHPLLTRGKRALEQALGRRVKVGEWRFATDGGHLMAAGIPVIGFGPCEESVVHTVQERVSMDMLVEGMAGYMALALDLGRRA